MQVGLRFLDSQDRMVALALLKHALEFECLERQKYKIRRSKTGVVNATRPFIDQKPDVSVEFVSHPWARNQNEA